MRRQHLLQITHSGQLLCVGMMDGNVKVQAAAINMLNFALAHPDTCTHVFKSAQVSAPEKFGMQIKATESTIIGMLNVLVHVLG